MELEVVLQGAVYTNERVSEPTVEYVAARCSPGVRYISLIGCVVG